MAGRPSLYSKAYCNEIIEFMGQGYSKTAFAGEIGVHKGTLYDWAKEHPEFAEAMDIANAKRVRFWESKQITIAGTGIGSPVSVIFALKNADPEEWRDRREPSIAIIGANISELEIAQRIAALLSDGSRAALTLIEGGKTEP